MSESENSEYMVSFVDGLGPAACGWCEYSGKKGWHIFSHENGHDWPYEGPLTEMGRTYLLNHFGLASIAEKLSLQAIVAKSPRQLIAERRILENALDHPEHNPVSDCPGNNISAALAA